MENLLQITMNLKPVSYTHLMEGMELMVKKMLNTEQTMSNTTLTQLQEGLTTAVVSPS